MNKNTFIAVFISAHIIFIFLQVHKHTKFVQYTYTLQKLEKKRGKLQEKKQTYVQHLYALKDREAIKKFARTLHMRPVKLTQIKKIAI